MIVHARPRRSGKTADALAWLVESPEDRVLVVASARLRKDAIDRMLVHFRVRLREDAVVTWDHVMRGGLSGRNIDEIWYDQLDYMLVQVTQTTRITATIDEELTPKSSSSATVRIL